MTLVEGAVFVAASIVLSFIKIFSMPQGGDITIDVIPLLIMSFRIGIKGGVLACISNGLIQLLLGLNYIGFCNNAISVIGCIFLDYLLAYGIIGLSSFFVRLMKKRNTATICIASTLVLLLKYFCSILSGWLIFGDYAWEGFHPLVYSILYNGSYMGPVIGISVVCMFILCKTAPSLLYIKRRKKNDEDISL